MKRVLTATAAVFGVLPGIGVILSGLGVPPGNGRQLVFGGVVEAFGVVSLLLLRVNRSRLRASSSRFVNLLTVASAAAAFATLLLYLGVYGYCVVTQEPRGTVYFPLWTSGDLSDLISQAGGRAAAIEAYGRYAVYDAVNRAGDFPIVMTDATLLALYALLFTFLTLASGIPATYLAASGSRSPEGRPAVMFLAALVILVGGAHGGVAHAATLVVDTPDDDATLQGCTPVDTPPDCSLRGAIALANVTPGFDTIMLRADGYDVSLGELVITTNISLLGDANLGSTLRGNGQSRVLLIEGGNVLLANVLITGGHVTSDFIPGGGGIRILEGSTVLLRDSEVWANGTVGPNGGGIANRGFLRIFGSRIWGNQVPHNVNTDSNDPSGFTGRGGGVYNTGDLIIYESEISENGASAGGGIFNLNGRVAIANSAIVANSTISNCSNYYDCHDGGGIYNRSGLLRMTNVTIADNSAGRYGGGIISNGGGRGTGTFITYSTIAHNYAGFGGGGGIVRQGPDTILEVGSSIIVDNLNIFDDGCMAVGPLGFDPPYPTDAFEPLTSKGYNIEDRDSCNLHGPGDQTWVQTGFLLVGSLSTDGGSTRLLRLFPLSPAIDRANPSSCPSVDQRGYGRPVNARCDIGAFEYGAVPKLPVRD